MSLRFYTSIIEDEKKIFNVKEKTLKTAVEEVTAAYNAESLKDGSTFLDYNKPQNRCAYLYKYAAIHTGVVNKYFKEILNVQSVKITLDYRKELKICCLGGGPGTDIVGICLALSEYPSFHQKVAQVTVLDICGGWRNSFKHVISRLKHGKIEGVPATFIDSKNFKADLIEVNLLKTLPKNVVKIISNADIVCMVKFVSAIMGKKESLPGLKKIGENIKLGATVLFIDNISNKVYGPLQNISQQCGLSSVLGPQRGIYKRSRAKAEKDVYGCSPSHSTQVSVIGWIKTVSLAASPVTIDKVPTSSSVDDNDDNWDTESDSDDFRDKCSSAVLKKISESKNKPKLSICKSTCDKFTQTESKYLSNSSKKKRKETCEIKDLQALMDAVNDLVNIVEHFKLRKNVDCSSKHYCHSH
ncbi:uncharacterized protein TNCT_59721 [Trichonephila clavata]|uniref:Uncharacterized protein n=1 Tax=Trichonephila clavata TaxID=2740835 RepID=A0A8X6FV94_TRICU|nr:uncharacterized protein TNCT_59721 [Trichonephila clavata]